MLGRLIYKLFPFHADRTLKEIFAAATVRRLAISMIAIFEPIYLYQVFGDSAPLALTFIGAAYLVYAFGSPLGGKFMEKIGVKHAILSSLPFLLMYYLALWYLEALPALWLAVIAVLLLGAHRSLFWPAYHTEFVRHSQNERRSEEQSAVLILSRLAMMAGPLLGGFIIASFGFGVLFTVVLLVLMAGAVPLLISPDTREAYSQTYLHSLTSLFNRQYWRGTLAFIGYGIEMVAVIFLWPLFMFAFNVSFEQIGIAGSASALGVVLGSFIMGRITDKDTTRQKPLKWGIVINFFTTILRMVPRTFPMFLGVGLISRLSRVSLQMPFSARTYDLAAYEAGGADEYIVYRSVALSLARALTLFGSAIFLLFFPLEQIWILFGVLAPFTFLIWFL